MSRFYPLGLTQTPREIITLAFGDTPHPLTPTFVECKRLARDGTMVYELSKGRAYGKDLWTVLFARVVDGKPTALPDASKCFISKSTARDWIDTVEKNGMAS
jgi:hypothetical protein